MVTRPFGELLAVPLKNGLTRPKRVRGVGVKMVNMGELFSYRRIGNVPMDRVPLAEKERTFLLEPEDLLFARQSLVLSGAGKCSLFTGASEPVTFESHLIRARLDSCVADARFYYYFFSSYYGRKTMETIVEQVSAAGIRGSDLARLRVPVPPLPEQKAIAGILGALDDKIALNRKMNRTLEEMARALFKAWFVDFEPVRAKMAGHVPTSCSPDVAALFPDKLVPSELGMIPEGWEVKAADEVFEVNPRRSLRRGVPAPYLPMSEMPTQIHRPEATLVREFGSGQRFVNGDTLVARITPCLENGKTAFVDFLPDAQAVGWGSTEYIVLRPKPPLPLELAYLWARDQGFRLHLIHNMTGSSGRQRVPADCLGDFAVPLPPGSVAEAFGKLVSPLFARVSASVKESHTLAELRDTLLPKLISGEVRVAGAPLG